MWKILPQYLFYFHEFLAIRTANVNYLLSVIIIHNIVIQFNVMHTK